MDEQFSIGPLEPLTDAAQVGVMRRIAKAALQRHGLAALVDAAALVVSELVGNAVLHSGTAEVRTIMVVRSGILHIVVVDGMPGQAVLRTADDVAESGRGLFLVEAVAAECGGSWGTSCAGACTWCRLPVPDHPVNQA
ncbi:ATP-binding protein [Streptomyces arenae]|uniref:ATP-binding protein n=1 Tax=Streptomyces arenae TaxID=29301 RepID=UPI00265A108C|nr:ATP-binding protein [Streptomyces arenae]MCG7202355.1 ATP-binding protein [Streptomyces arenae]